MNDQPPRARDGWCLSGALLVLYCVLGQGSLYKVDGQSLLWLSNAGVTQHDYHTLYLPGLEVLKVLCAPFGLGLYETARLYSALGSALGMWFVHAACRQLHLSRLGCNVVTLLLGTCPVVLFFATVVEVHGPFLAFAGAAWAGAARLLRSRHALAAPLIGACFGAAYLSHPTAALMVFMLPVVCALGARTLPDAEPFSLQRCAITTALAGVSMGVFILAVPRILNALFGTEASAGSAWFMLTNYPGDDLLAPLRTLEIALDEWLLPLFPAAVLALWAGWRRDLRVPTLLLLAGLVPHLFVAQLMLKGYSERGAYLLPAALPTVLLALEVLDRHRLLILPALLASAALAVVEVERHDEPERPRSMAAGLAQLSGDQPFLLIAGHPHDIETMLLYFEDLKPHWLGATIGQTEPGIAKALEGIDRFATELNKLNLATFLSKATFDSLQRAIDTDQWLLSHDPELLVSGRGAAAKRILEHLQAKYRLVPVRAAGFDGYRLRLR